LALGGIFHYRNMMNLIKIILLVIIAIAAVLFLTGRYVNVDIGKNLYKPGQDLSQLDLLMPNEEGEITQKTFISPDKSLSINYLSDWIEIEDTKREEIISQDIAEKYDLKVLFLAQKLKEGKVAQLIVTKGVFEDIEKTEEIIDIIIESDRKKGWETKVLEKEEIEEGLIFEAVHQKTSIETLYSKEKILLSQDKAYIITTLSPENQWYFFEEELDNILSSVKLSN